MLEMLAIEQKEKILIGDYNINVLNCYSDN